MGFWKQAARSARAARVMLCLSLVSVTTLPAMAQTEMSDFNIQAQPLKSALINFSRQSRVQLLVVDELVEGKTAPAVVGSFSNEQALQRLLAGTGLRYEFSSAKQVRLIAPQRESVVTLPPFANSVSSLRPLPLPTSFSGTEEIVVTGTRIRGAGPVGSEVVSLNREQIARTGGATTAEVIRTLPQNLSLGPDEGRVAGVQNPNNSGFGSSANLRGLGPDATLVLLNGHRLAPSGQGTFVDLSQIPVPVIERIEVVADGASAVYGSDAVGGVINFILRRDYEGVEASARIGGGDGFSQYTAGGTVGTRWRGGNGLVSYEFYRRTRLAASARSYQTDDLRAFGGPDLRQTTSAPGNISANGTSYAIPLGQNGVGLTAAQLRPGTQNLQNRYDGTDIYPSQNRHSAVASVSQDLSDKVRVFADSLYSQRGFDVRLPAAVGGLSVPSTNPFFVSPVAGARSVSVLYSFVRDLGPLDTHGSAAELSTTIGASVELPYGWHADVDGTYSADEVRSRTENLSNSFYRTLALADPNPATAYNPFGDGAVTNPRTLAATRGWGEEFDRYRVRDLTGEISGPILRLSGGEIRLAFGGEYRSERLKFSNVNLNGTAQPALAGDASLHRTVRAGFGELLVPIVGEANAIAGVRRLELSAAGRVERYSDFGSSSNPKVGARWSPVDDLTLRASWGTSFKAPQLRQLNEAANNYGTVTRADPRSSTGSSIVLQLGGNNARLKPETAETWSAGVDLRPSWAPGLTLSTTYFSVDYSDRILAIGSGDIATVLVREDIFAPQITRNPSAASVLAVYADPRFNTSSAKVPPAQVAAIVDARAQNAGSVKQSGIDVSASYGFSTPIGNLDLSASLTYLDRYAVARSRTSPSIDQLATLGNPVDLRLRGGVVWQQAEYSASFFVNHVDGYLNNSIVPAVEVSSFTTVDTQFGYKTGTSRGVSDIEIVLNVQNLFDAQPPAVANASVALGYNPEQASALGRIISLSISKRW